MVVGVCCERRWEDQLLVHLKGEGEKTRLALDAVLAVVCAGSPVLPELKWPRRFQILYMIIP